MAPQQPKSAVNVVFGAMIISNGAEQSRVSDLDEASESSTFSNPTATTKSTHCATTAVAPPRNTLVSSTGKKGVLSWTQSSILPLGIPRIEIGGHIDRNICGRTYGDH